jgi:hypothetical protein
VEVEQIDHTANDIERIIATAKRAKTANDETTAAFLMGIQQS